MLSVTHLTGFADASAGELSVSLGVPSVAVDTVDAFSYLFNGMSVGAAAANRKIVLLICGEANGTAAIASVTVSGASLTTVVSTSGLGPVGIYIFDYPSGATINVGVNFNVSGGLPLRCGCVAYPVYGLTGNSPHDAKVTDVHPFTHTINSPPNGVIFGISHGSDTVEHTAHSDWTGLIERVDMFMGVSQITVAAETFGGLQSNRYVYCTLTPAPVRPGSAVASFS